MRKKGRGKGIKEILRGIGMFFKYLVFRLIGGKNIVLFL